MTPLAAIFAEYENTKDDAFLPKDICSPEIRGALRRLLNDDRMPNEWKRIRTSHSTLKITDILDAVQQCIWRAHTRHRIKSEVSRITDKYNSLISSANNLLDHLEGTNTQGLPSFSEDQYFSSGSPEMVEAQRTIVLLKNRLQAKKSETLETLTKYTPRSQKLSSRSNTFSVLMCCDLMELFGKPDYEFAVTITEVVYETEPGTMSVDALRRAFARDQKKRRDEAEPPITDTI